MQDSKRDTDIQNSLLDSVGEGKGGMIWEDGSAWGTHVRTPVADSYQCMTKTTTIL